MLNELAQEKIVAIVRAIPAERADQAIDALVEGGIRFLEVTMNTDGALLMLSRWKDKYGSRLKIGAGTVLDLEMAKDAISAGAEYLISPNLDESVIHYGERHRVDVYPGTMSPTEIVKAWKAGAKAVKVFPMGTLGAGYLKEIRAPLNAIPMIATGGVNLSNIREFLNAGALAVGLGGNLVNNGIIQSGDFAKLTELARAFITAAKGEE